MPVTMRVCGCLATLKALEFACLPAPAFLPSAMLAASASSVCTLAPCAAEGDIAEMVRALLAAGADPNVTEPSSGLTALHKACYYAAGPGGCMPC